MRIDAVRQRDGRMRRIKKGGVSFVSEERMRDLTIAQDGAGLGGPGGGGGLEKGIKTLTQDAVSHYIKTLQRKRQLLKKCLSANCWPNPLPS